MLRDSEINDNFAPKAPTGMFFTGLKTVSTFYEPIANAVQQ